MPCILCLKTLKVIGVSWRRQLSFGFWLVICVHQRCQQYRSAIWSRWHPLTMFCFHHVTQERNIREDRRWCPFVWGWCVDTGTEWLLMGRPEMIRPVWTTVMLFYCCRWHANMWRLPSSAERLTDPTLPQCSPLLSESHNNFLTEGHAPTHRKWQLCGESENKYGLWAKWTQVE